MACLSQTYCSSLLSWPWATQTADSGSTCPPFLKLSVSKESGWDIEGAIACAREREEGNPEEWGLLGRGWGLPGTLRSLEMLKKSLGMLRIPEHAIVQASVPASVLEADCTSVICGNTSSSGGWLQSSVSTVLTTSAQKAV